MSEPLLFGTEAQRLRDVLDVLELLAVRQAAQLGEDAVRRVGLLRLGGQGAAVGGPDLLAERLGERRPALDVAGDGAGRRPGLVRIAHGLLSPSSFGVRTASRRRCS